MAETYFGNGNEENGDWFYHNNFVLEFRQNFFSSRVLALGDSKWLWINMATMYETLCGNAVGRTELTFL
jgi:hypothetical protein